MNGLLCHVCLGQLTAILVQFCVLSPFALAEKKSESLPAVDHKPFSSSMTVVPPVTVTDQVEVEIRVSIRNHTTKKTVFDVAVMMETATGETHPVMGTPIEVEPLGQELFSTRIATNKHVGKHSVHYRVTGPQGCVQRGQWPLTVVRSDSRSLPLLQIAWIDPGALVPPPKAPYPLRSPVTERDVRLAVDRLHSLGMKSLIITYPETLYLGGGVFYPSEILSHYGTPVSFDVVGTLLNQASKNGQHVFIGLGRGPDLLLTWTGFDDPKRILASQLFSMKIATELWMLYSHEPSFYGWYLSHEANDIEQASVAYYNPMVDFLRTFEADKPVLISPSGTPILSSKILSKSKVDIFAYQDAVGSGYIPYENTFDPQRRIDMLEEVYSSYSEAHRGTDKHLWTNLEIWQMDGPSYGNSYPPSFDRVRKQIEIEMNHVDVISTYTVFGFMEHPESQAELGGQKAVDLYEAYRDYYQNVVGGFDQAR